MHSHDFHMTLITRAELDDVKLLFNVQINNGYFRVTTNRL